MMQLTTPERCTLINLDTDGRITCQFNPSVLELQGGTPQYASLSPLGVPYQVLHYLNTENPKLLLAFYMDAIGSSYDIKAFGAFLEAATLLAKGGAKPPAIMCIWPGALTVVGHVTEHAWTVEQQAPTGAPLVCLARCTLEIDQRATNKLGGH